MELSEKRFDEWFEQLKLEMKKGGNILYDSEDQECWREYWLEGLTPAEALIEDADAAQL